MDQESIFAERLHMCRWKSKMTITELAQEAHTTASAIRDYEHGQRQPKLATLVLLAKALGVSIDYLAGLTDDASERRSGFGHQGEA